MDFATDHDVLRAALEFVDAFSSEASAPKMQPAARLRWELETLREENKRLECHVAHLHQVTAQRRQNSAAHQVAQCQRQRRRRAEVDNAQLRSRLRESSLLTRRIVKTLKAASKDRDRALQHLYPALSSIPRSLCTIEWSNLTLEALRMCDQATAIFRHAHFAPAPGRDPCATRQVLTKKPSRRGLHIELADSRAMPFNICATGEAIWYHIAHHNVLGDALVKTRGRVSEHQIEREFLFRSGPHETPTVFHTKVGARRLVTSDSVTITWAVDIQAEADGARLSASEKVWILVQPLRIDAKQDRPVALVQTYLVSTPSRRVGKSLVVEDSFGPIETHMEEQWAHAESLLLDPVWMAAHCQECDGATSTSDGSDSP